MPVNNAWKEEVLEIAENILCIPATRARPRASSASKTTDATGGDKNVRRNNDEEVPHTDDKLESPSKRQRQEDTPVVLSAPACIGQAVLRCTISSGQKAMMID